MRIEQGATPTPELHTLATQSVHVNDYQPNPNQIEVRVEAVCSCGDVIGTRKLMARAETNATINRYTTIASRHIDRMHSRHAVAATRAEP